MNSGYSQSQRQTQSQTQYIAPQLRQSLKILQSSALELRNAILEELQTNPTLEELPLDDISIEAKGEGSDTEDTSLQDNSSSDGELDFSEDYAILQKMEEDWRDNYSENAVLQKYTSEDERRRQHFFDSLVSETSLQEHLMEQAVLSECSPDVQKALRYLIGSLDDHGFLSHSMEELAVLSGYPKKDLEEASRILKTFEPVGIGCASVQDCLIHQLESREEVCPVAIKILKDHFPLFLRRRVQELAHKIGVTVRQVESALQIITALDPDPGGHFREDTNRSVHPDITIEKMGDDWTVVLNSDYIPRLRINQTYKSLIAKGELKDKEREYLRDKIKSSKFLISSIEQRQQTLERIAREILTTQINFFEKGIAHLKPMTMHEIADRLGVHETTISRAIANKFIKTPYGVYDMKYFFTSGFTTEDGTSISNTTIKDKIAHIITTEDPVKPYSDQKIVEMLKQENITVARRTVAKYRDELGIPPTSMRRRF